jgi:hypothetical protein
MMRSLFELITGLSSFPLLAGAAAAPTGLQRPAAGGMQDQAMSVWLHCTQQVHYNPLVACLALLPQGFNGLCAM